eukprot:scaffold160907_cov19-Tisochrysis_lutea.AAC.1
MEVQVKPPMAVTNAVSWRKEGIKHKKNEVGHRGKVKGLSLMDFRTVLGEAAREHLPACLAQA